MNFKDMSDDQLQAEQERQRAYFDEIEAEQTRRRNDRVAEACKAVLTTTAHLPGSEQIQALDLAKSQVESAG